MRIAFALCVLLCVSVAFGYNTEEVFQSWMRQHGKKYQSLVEYQERLNVFSANVAKIQRMNAASTGATYNLTRFADMTEEEFRSYPCGVSKLSDIKGPQPEISHISTQRVGVLPTSFDWTTKGAVTPVKDQGQCGSCWAFSTVGMLEGAWKIAGHPLTGLSEQEFVSCSTTSFGCDGGWPFWALSDILEKEGGHVDTETSYPYTAANGVCKYNPNTIGASYTKYTSLCTEQTAACTETNMMDWLVHRGPLSACLNATPMQFYSGGVDDPTNCSPTEIDHCITIVGYGNKDGKDFWKIKNSWGTGWGEQGYYYLIRGKGACGINKVITLATI